MAGRRGAAYTGKLFSSVPDIALSGLSSLGIEEPLPFTLIQALILGALMKLSAVARIKCAVRK